MASNILCDLMKYQVLVKFTSIVKQVIMLLIISPVTEGSGDVMVLRRSRPPPAMVLTR